MEDSSLNPSSSTPGPSPGVTPAMEEYGWHEDNIQIDFMTVDDLRKLLEKSGHKLEANIYRESVTLVASMVEESTTVPLPPLTSGPSSASSSSPSSSAAAVASSSSTSPVESFTHVVANTFQRTGSFGSPPSPSAPTPLTLSLGSWSISEEEFPLYIGSAAGILLLLFVLLTATTWRCLAAGDRKRRRREDLEKRINSPSLLSSTSHVHHISSHDSMVCLSGTRIESRIIDPHIKDDGGGGERNHLLREDLILSSPKNRCAQGSRIVTDVDDVIGHSSPNHMDDMNTYVKLAPVVDNFLASQATFHTFHPSHRLSKKQSSDGMSSCKTSPNELDLDDSLTAAEVAELQEEARDTFASLPFPARRLHSDLYNGNVSLNSNNNNNNNHQVAPEQQQQQLAPSSPNSLKCLYSNMNTTTTAVPPSLNNFNNFNNAQSTALEDLYSKVDYNSKLKNRCPHDGVAVVSPLPPHKSPSPSLLSFSKQQTSLCEDDEEIEFHKAPSSLSTSSNPNNPEEPNLFYNIRTSL